MSKGIDIVPLLNWVTQQQAFKKEEAKPAHRTKKEKEPDIFALVAAKRKELAQLEAMANDLGKLYKKDDDKKKKDSPFSVVNIALFLIASSPITGPLYVWWFRHLLGT